MRQVTLVTTNRDKVRTITAHLARLEIDVRHLNASLIEPQADTIAEVAHTKAREAFRLAGAPVLVDDSGFCIDDLDGFPGPYTKYALSTIGVDGLLSLTRGLPSPRCRFVNALVYIDATGESHAFIDDEGAGWLARKADLTPCPEAWSELWHIFIPDGYDRPLSALAAEERADLWALWAANSVYARFGRWIRGGGV